MNVCHYPNCGKDQRCTDLCEESKLIDRLYYRNDQDSIAAAEAIKAMRQEIQMWRGPGDAPPVFKQSDVGRVFRPTKPDA